MTTRPIRPKRYHGEEAERVSAADVARIDADFTRRLAEAGGDPMKAFMVEAPRRVRAIVEAPHA